MSDKRLEPAGVNVLDVIKMSEDGLILQKVSSIEECLDGSPTPASTLRDIFTRIDVTLQNDETLQEWVSELVEKVTENQQWLKDQETDLEQWRDMFPAIVESAKKGKNIRNKRREDLKKLLAMGVGGPRFERMLETSSRNFLNSVRKEVVLHGFSYPLVCCLANVKTYHRLIGHSRGVQKTRYTQPIDLSHLDSVAYRELSDNELAATGVAIGPAGFLVPLGADRGSPVHDADFDKAVASFQPGLRGAQQPLDHGKVEPKADDEQEESHARPKKFLVKHDAFPFAPSCDCGAGVDEELKASIDNMKLGDGFEAVQSISQQLLASIDMLCARHCQLALVRGLGSSELRDKSNVALLRTQLAGDVEGLVAYIHAKPRAKDEYSSFKAALGGFSWAKVADFAKANGRARAKRKTRR